VTGWFPPAAAGSQAVRDAAFWEPGGDEITPTMKLKRRAITTKYDDVIESLYA